MMDTVTLLATFVGALIQVAVGVGFSVVVGPVLVLGSGAKAAVPTLLALNVVVSIIGMYGFRLEDGAGAVGQSIGGTLVGILVGAATFPYLSESFVTTTMGLMLLGGSLLGWGSCRQLGWKAVAGIGTISGIATAWSATPGPVMALGLIMAGHDGSRVRLLVQPISLAAYGIALGMLGQTVWSVALTAPHMGSLLATTVMGSLLGLLVGPRLPSPIFLHAIRIFSAIAGLMLLARAIAN